MQTRDRDEKWAAKNFGRLVTHYGGSYVGILGQKVIAHGKTPKQVIKKSGMSAPYRLYLFKVPTQKELICLL